MDITLTKSQARKIILHAAGLSKRAQFGKGKEAAYKAIDHLGFVQIDTNYIVERAHHHTLAARIPDYNPKWLEELQAEGRIFEFWTFAAGYIPIHDFRFSLPVKASFQSRRKALTQAGVPIRNYYAVCLPDNINEPFARQGEMIDHFSELFGPYPFEVYGALVMDTEFGAALENQTGRPLRMP